MKKGQISTEFLIIASMALIVFSILLSIADRRNDELYAMRTTLYAREEADTLASNIHSIFFAGDGAQKTVSLPETLRDGTNYTIAIYPSNHLLEITWSSQGEQKSYTTTLVTANVTALSGLYNTTLTIANNGGVIIA